MSSSRQSSPGFFYSPPALPSHPGPLNGSSQKEQKPRETEHWGSETTESAGVPMPCQCWRALLALPGWEGCNSSLVPGTPEVPCLSQLTSAPSTWPVVSRVSYSA